MNNSEPTISFESIKYSDRPIMVNCSNFFKIEGIYFLWHKNVIVYIGESRCVMSRIISHKSDKEFDRFSFQPFRGNYQERLEKEAALIFLHKPKYNKQIGKEGNLKPKQPKPIRSAEDKKKLKKLSNWENFKQNVLPVLESNFGITQYHWNSYRISKGANLFLDYYPGRGRTFIYETKEWIDLTADELLQNIEIYLGPIIK